MPAARNLLFPAKQASRGPRVSSPLSAASGTRFVLQGALGRRRNPKASLVKVTRGCAAGGRCSSPEEGTRRKAVEGFPMIAGVSIDENPPVGPQARQPPLTRGLSGVQKSEKPPLPKNSFVLIKPS